MPALSDIPERLLDDASRAEFIKWVNGLPMFWWDKKQLMTMWAQFNKTKFTAAEFGSGGAHRK